MSDREEIRDLDDLFSISGQKKSIDPKYIHGLDVKELYWEFIDGVMIESISIDEEPLVQE